MIEKRKHHRVNLSTKTVLSQQDTIYHGNLENISQNGALLRLEHGTYLPEGSENVLTVFIEWEAVPYRFKTVVVCESFAIVGVKFLSYLDDTETRLAKLIEKLSYESDLERFKQDRFKRHLAEMFRDERSD